MSPERQRIAIAEWCGWKRKPEYDYTLFHPAYRAGEVMEMMERDGDIRAVEELPDYLNDLNAMAQAEKKLLTGACDDVRSLYLDYVFLQSPGFPDRFETHMTALTATAAQRAEALLKTIGKWENDA